ncbi:hypothetical protein CTEN210_00815 [Chaetoceros tenuissimus]|uniref:Uncharacterized protein n=1 Tax=Chaetoceros tenuissimus TaxID=426638 RepID=A0AAD3GZ48_9STRA|nr:hypothetical protein CTEN210_00815 [Chaetoceros tenuissimus]
MSTIAQRAIAANIVKCIFSILSLAASSTIVHMIRFSPRGLKSPYSRIIFGLSIGDIIQSLGIFLGVFAVPKDTPESPMALGNQAACDYTGLLLLVGVLVTVFYLLFLIYFFWRRVKHKVAPQKFAYGEERYLHILCWVLSLTYGIVAVALKAVNPTRYGSTCVVTSKPFGCGVGQEDDEDYLECTRGTASGPMMGRILGIVLGVSLLGLFTFLASITCHVYAIERTLSTPRSTLRRHDGDEQQGSNSQEEESEEDTTTNQEAGATGNDNEIQEKERTESLTRSSMNQSILYIVAFIMTFAMPIAFLAAPGFRNDHYEVIIWSTSTLLPTYGIFLILIYTRPKVQILQKMFPKASWRLCFTVVVTSGGEVPPAHELKPSIHLLSQLSEVDSQHALSYSSESTNGVYYEGLRKSMVAASRYEGWHELQN